MIEKYRFGSITVSGRQYTSDLKIIHGQVHSDWWRKNGHLVDIDDVVDIIGEKPDYLVIGSGSSGLMKVNGPLQEYLADCGIRLITEPTSIAVETFNQLYGEGKDIAGGFHLTC
jgi:hypothetical protein